MTGKILSSIFSLASRSTSEDAGVKRTGGIWVNSVGIEFIGHLVLCSNARAQHGEREQGG